MMQMVRPFAFSMPQATNLTAFLPLLFAASIEPIMNERLARMLALAYRMHEKSSPAV